MKLDEFERHALPHLDGVYRFAMVLVNDVLDASRHVQATYRRALEAADEIAREDPEFRLSLLRILRALIAADSRSSKYEAEDLYECMSSIDDRQTLNHDDLIRETIKRFPARYRSVLLLWSAEGLTCEQIAEIEDVPTNIVRRWLHDARDVMHELLERTSCHGSTRDSHCSGLIEHANGTGQEVIQ